MIRLLSNLLVLTITVLLLFAVGETVTRFSGRAPMHVVVERFAQIPQPAAGRTGTVARMPDSLYQFTTTGGVRLAPNAQVTITKNHTSGRDVELVTNALGLRDSPIPPKRSDEYRILVLGDSITLGDYVDAGETYPELLERAFEGTTAPVVRVINAGIGGADIRNEAELLKEIIAPVQPDLVLVGLYLNDGELSANIPPEPLPAWLRWSTFASWLQRRYLIARYRLAHRSEWAQHSQAWQTQFVHGRTLRAGAWASDHEAFDYMVVNNVRDWGAAWNPATWEVVAAHLQAMQALTAAHQAQLAVALLPVRYQVESQFDEQTPQALFAELMARLQLPHLDLLPALRADWQTNTASADRLYYDRCHMTPAGNTITARTLAGWLRSQIPD